MPLVSFPEDELAIEAGDVVLVRALDEGDIDARTGHLVRGVPVGKRAALFMRGGGHVWVSVEWAVAVRRLNGGEQ